MDAEGFIRATNPKADKRERSLRVITSGAIPFFNE